jgi:hypothetical protein
MKLSQVPVTASNEVTGQLQPTRISDHWGEFLLTKDWSHWATFTTPYELTMPGARRLADRVHRSLNSIAPTTIFWASEPFDVKEGHHIHALLNVPKTVPFEVIVSAYKNVSSSPYWSAVNSEGFNDWQIVNKQCRIQLDSFNPDWQKEGSDYKEERRGATFYVGKYLCKLLSDYDYLTPKRKRGERGRKKPVKTNGWVSLDLAPLSARRANNERELRA